MPEYIIAYHGGKKPESPEAGAQRREPSIWRNGSLENAIAVLRRMHRKS